MLVTVNVPVVVLEVIRIATYGLYDIRPVTVRFPPIETSPVKGAPFKFAFNAKAPIASVLSGFAKSLVLSTLPNSTFAFVKPVTVPVKVVLVRVAPVWFAFKAKAPIASVLSGLLNH